VPGALNALIDATPDERMGGAKLVLVWESDARVADAELAEATSICLGLGAESTGEEPARHWLAHRHSVSYRQSPIYAAGAFVDTMEVASTWARLLPMYRAVREALSRHVFVMAHFSHAYPDGASIYFTFAGSARDDDASVRVYDEAWRAALEAVVRAGGTFSHHHGVGRSKAPAMREEQGAAIDVVRALKRVFDPGRILNLGALIPSVDASPAPTAPPISSREDAGDALITELRRELPGDFDETGREPILLAASARHVGIALRIARRLGAPIVPPGGIDRVGGLRLDLRRMPELLAIDPTSRIAHVQAGISLVALDRELVPFGLGLGFDPEPGVDVGTWLALGAPGARDPDDDPIAQIVAGFEALLPDGRAIEIRPAPRRAVGPDLVGAFVGARGALGVIVGAHLLVRPREARTTRAFLFPTPDGAEHARAWARGRAIRPAGTRITRVPEGSALRVDLEGEGDRLRAALAVLDDVAKERGSVPAKASDVAFDGDRRAPLGLGQTLTALARELDPARVLSP
jgi:FAD/FMN-containing dehydrogenase